MPVEFLTDDQALAYGRFSGSVSRAELERCFFLDDGDRLLVGRRRGDANRLGFALQLGVVRLLGTFPPDLGEVPAVAVDYVADELGIADRSCLASYAAREKTRLEHEWEITRALGFRSFASAEAELTRWLDDRAWTTGEGPKALFDGAVAWLRERLVLLPGVSVLARLVALVRDEVMQRLWDVLAGLVTPRQARVLEGLLKVPLGSRRSDLERLRKGGTAVSGKAMVAALDRVAEVRDLGLGSVTFEGVPQRRIVELARWGMAGRAPVLRRHPRSRKLATLLATVAYLEAKATDDALELFDVLMTNELMGRAVRQAKKQTLRRYPRVSKDAATCAAAVGVLLESVDSGDEISLQALWTAVEAVVSRSALRSAVANLAAVLPPPGSDPGGEWRSALMERYAVVRPFARRICEVIDFGATADAMTTLDALRGLPALLDARATKRVPAGYLDVEHVTSGVVPAGWWQQLVFQADRPPGTVDRAAYVFCVLEQFHQRLRRRDIFAVASSRWTDPRAKLLTGPAWEAAKGPVLNALQLPADPGGLLEGHASDLDDAWHGVASSLDAGARVTIDDDGRLHAAALEAIPEPASLIDLRDRVEAMIPRVDIGELILEVMEWHPEFLQAFRAASGGQPRLKDLGVTIAAALTAHALNVGFGPVISPGIPALTRARISHVDQNYLRAENYAAANAPLIRAQSDIALARALGGGMVAAVDGLRFIVPVRSVDSRPNPKYFGRRRGATWLNMISDRSVGLSGKVVSGTPRDSLHLIDLIYRQDAGQRPEVIVSDTGAYSDIVFGLLRLLGFSYRPQLADLPDAKLWRIDPAANYGPLNAAARGKIDVSKIDRHWPDITRMIASIHTGAVSAHDVIRMLAHGGNPTQLGDALAHYGPIFKTLHILTYVDDEPYRREIKTVRNLQEGRHDLARHVFHGRRGHLRQAYHEGMEDQLGALGLVLNAITLWNTVYIDAAITQLRADGHPISDADLARLSLYIRRHLNVDGHYFFPTPQLGGRRRALREPDAGDHDLS